MTTSPSTIRRLTDAVVGERYGRDLASAKTTGRALLRNKTSSSGRSNERNVRSYRSIHADETCVIIGNGPSLNDTDLALLRGHPTFGLNRIYLAHERLPSRPTYHVVVNKLVVEQCADELRRIDGPLFSTYDNSPLLAPDDQTILLNSLLGPRFSRTVHLGVWQGTTVTFVAMQLAHYMGFSRVVLIGVDHNFASKGPAHQVVESHGDDPNHFDSGYFGRGFRWQLPDLDTSEVAYRLARDAFEADGREILDATVGGKLTIFPKVELSEALR